MALNPPLLPDGRPMGLAGEWFLLERRGVAAAIDTHDPAHRVLKAAGCRVLVTTARMVVLPPSHTVNFRGFDIPFQGITGERFVQPVFGANRLELDVAAVPGRGLAPAAGAPVHVALTFNEGGCNRFLRMFFALVERNRQAAAAVPAAVAALAAPSAWVASELEAYVDPSDPSVIYVTQAPSGAPPAPPPQQPAFVAQPAPQPVYAPQPGGYAPQPAYAAQPAGFAPQPAYVPQQVYPSQPVYAPAPGAGGYVPAQGGAYPTLPPPGYAYPPQQQPQQQPQAPVQPGYYAPAPAPQHYV